MLLPENCRDLETTAVMLGRARKCLLRREHIANDIGTENVLEWDGVTRCGHVGRGNFAHRCDDVHNLAKFTRQVIYFAIRQVNSRKASQVAHGFSRDVRHNPQV